MPEDVLKFQIPGAQWSIEFPLEIIARLSGFAQKGWRSKEAAGQLYSSDLIGRVLRVERVTKLPAKWASYSGVRLDLNAVARDRERQFAEGFHCLGFWHSHPEPCPEPSPADLVMAADHARAGKQDFQGLIFIIVGNAAPPDGFGVWVHDGEKAWRAVVAG